MKVRLTLARLENKLLQAADIMNHKFFFRKILRNFTFLINSRY